MHFFDGGKDVPNKRSPELPVEQRRIRASLIPGVNYVTQPSTRIVRGETREYVIGARDDRTETAEDLKRNPHRFRVETTAAQSEHNQLSRNQLRIIDTLTTDGKRVLRLSSTGRNPTRIVKGANIESRLGEQLKDGDLEIKLEGEVLYPFTLAIPSKSGELIHVEVNPMEIDSQTDSSQSQNMLFKFSVVAEKKEPTQPTANAAAGNPAERIPPSQVKPPAEASPQIVETMEREAKFEVGAIGGNNEGPLALADSQKGFIGVFAGEGQDPTVSAHLAQNAISKALTALPNNFSMHDAWNALKHATTNIQSSFRGKENLTKKGGMAAGMCAAILETGEGKKYLDLGHAGKVAGYIIRTSGVMPLFGHLQNPITANGGNSNNFQCPFKGDDLAILIASRQLSDPDGLLTIFQDPRKPISDCLQAVYAYEKAILKEAPPAIAAIRV